jgi:cyclase
MIRIIARLDVKPPFVVKPIQFEGLRKIGKPADIANKYYLAGADEILYLDIVASLYQREILFKEIENTSKGIFVPFAGGGGVKSIDDFILLLRNGVDKVVINTYALKNPTLISMASEILGSQSVVVHIEAKKWVSHWECYTDCGRVPTGKDVLEWALEVEKLGAGEIIISSVDNDGMKKGFDIDLVKLLTSNLSIPVVAASGAGSKADVLKVIKEAKPDAVALGSLLHYDIATIGELKKYLLENGVNVKL